MVINIMFTALLSIGPLGEQDATKKLLSDAEAMLFSTCLQSRGRSIPECECYVSELKSEMAVPDYHFFLEALYYSNQNDRVGFNKAMEKYGKTIEKLETMSSKVAVIGDKVIKECKKDIPTLPKPLKK